MNKVSSTFKRMRSVMLLTAAVYAVMAITLLAGCENNDTNGYIVDWSPVNIYIYATDADGKSIIQPDMPGMSLTFKGQTYTVMDWSQRDSIHTRAYLAIMYGLFAQPVDTTAYPPEYRLYFGEIDGAADMDEDIILKWPDGTVDAIHYHCSDHKESRPPKCNRSWKLNGETHEGSEFRFSGKKM